MINDKPSVAHTWKIQEWPVHNASWAHGMWHIEYDRAEDVYRILTENSVLVAKVNFTLVAQTMVAKNNEQVAAYEASHQITAGGQP